MLLLVPAFLLLAVPGGCGLWTVDRLTVRSSGSITVPCHYNYRFRGQVKYWCKGKFWSTCITLRNSAAVNITDSPAELVSTLTLSSLRIKDAGRYWCAIKRGGFRMSDIRTSLELQVTEDTPDLWVNSSSVSGMEAGNVTVKCYYSDRLKEDEKKWCRSGDLHSCLSEQDTQSSQHAKLQVRDEGQGVFTVTLTALQMDDGGWYWCMTGGIQSPVHLTIAAVSTAQNHTDFPGWTPPSQHSASTATTAVLTSKHTPYTSIHSTHTPQSNTTHTTHTAFNSTHATHTASNSSHSTHTASNSTHKPAGSSHSSSRMPIALSPSSPKAWTKHPSDSPSGTGITMTCAANRLFVWPLIGVGIMLTAAVVTGLIWRGQKHHKHNHTMLEWTEPMEFSVKDDVDLLDHEWTNRTVLKLEEEPNNAVLL